MQTRVRLARLDPLGAALPQQPNQAGQRPQYAGFLATFVPTEAPADGSGTGDMHLGGPMPSLHLVLGSDQANSLRINGDYTLSLTPYTAQ